jgi:phage gp36-like protein
MVAISATKKTEQLAATTELASGILAARFDLPITSWGGDLTQAVCKIAAYEILSVRGFNPDGDDKNVRDRYDDAMKWLADVAAGRITPIGLVDSTPDTEDLGGAEVVTVASRGWR